METTPASADTLRPRLQLVLGGIAVLGDELPALGGRRIFHATTHDSATPDAATPLRVVLHPLPPEGIEPAALTARLTALRDLAHPTLVLPVALGDFEGRAWVVEPASIGPTARDRLAQSGPLPMRDGIRVLRELTRALAAMHRRGLAHGAVDVDAVLLADPDARLASLAMSVSGTAEGDLSALARTMWVLLIRDVPVEAGGRLSEHRRGVPPALDTLLAAMLDAVPERRPERAEAVLDVLDALPAPPPESFARLFEGTGDGARQRRTKAMLALLVLIGALILVLLLVRQ